MHTHSGRRREDARLLTGKGRFTTDNNLPGQAHAVFIRADRPHAEIVSIDTDAARAMPGVVAILTAAELVAAGFKPHPSRQIPGRNGTTFKLSQRLSLAHGRVRFVGEAVALVVAETHAQAQDAAEQVQIEYRDLPAVIDAEHAVGATALHEIAPDNLALEYEYGSLAPVQEVFARAAHVARVSVAAPRIAGNPMEPKSCLIGPDGAGGYTMFLPHQGTGGMPGSFSTIVGEPADRFRIHNGDVGGAFGVRSEAYPEYMVILHAARLLKRPVKWEGARQESIVSDNHGRGVHMTGELALDAEGNFLALKVDWTVDLGAFASASGAGTNTVAAPTLMAVNIYKTPAVYGLHKLVYTNKTPTAAYRGAARPNVSYLVERLVDEAAKVTGIDRIELRRRNVIPASAFPYKTPTGSTYDSGDPAGLLDDVLEKCGWFTYEERRAESRARGRLRGLGLALFIEPSGGQANEQVSIRIGDDGNPILYSMAGPSGQGYETVYGGLVAKLFGMDAEQVSVRSSDPTGPKLTGAGSVGSRSLISHGASLVNCAREVIKKGIDLAATDLEVSATDIEFKDGVYQVAGTDVRVSMSDLMRKHTIAGDHPLNTQLELAVSGSFPSGAHVAEVEIDPETGVISVLSYVAVDDCGNVINEALVEGQLHGGLMQGFGQALMERCVYDEETGQVLTGTFLDYAMPRATDLPELSLHNRPVPSPTNVLGAKGAGEAGATGAIPTIVSAVLDALKAVNVTHVDLPFTPDRIWAAIQDAPRQ